jgi:hypothetical protein
MNSNRFLSVLITLCFAAMLVLPVKGQDSFDKTRSTDPSYRFGFGDGREQQVVEQAHPNAIQEAAKHGVDLQFQDPSILRKKLERAKLRNQIRELGNRSPVPGRISSETKEPGAFYFCINKDGNFAKKMNEEEIKKRNQEIENRYKNDLYKKVLGVARDEAASAVVELAAIQLGKQLLFKGVSAPIGAVLLTKDIVDIYEMWKKTDKALEELEKLSKENSKRSENQEDLHFHFYEYRAHFNTGFDETGIHTNESHSEAKKGDYTQFGDEYEVKIMQEANDRLIATGQWTKESFDAKKHNSKNFMDALKKEYETIKREIEAVEKFAEDYARTRRAAAISRNPAKLKEVDVSGCSHNFQEIFGDYQEVLLERIGSIGKRDVMKFAADKGKLRRAANEMKKELNKYKDKFDANISQQMYDYIAQDME